MRGVWVSFGLAVVGAVVFLFAPVGTSVTGVPAGSGQVSQVIDHPNAVEIDGWSAAIPAAVGVVIAGVPLLSRRRFAQPLRVVSAVLLGAFVLLGIFSVGLFYMPAWVAMIVAAARSSPPAETSVP